MGKIKELYTELQTNPVLYETFQDRSNLDEQDFIKWLNSELQIASQQKEED